LAGSVARRVIGVQGDKKDKKRKAEDAMEVDPKRSKGERALPSSHAITRSLQGGLNECD